MKLLITNIKNAKDFILATNIINLKYNLYWAEKDTNKLTDYIFMQYSNVTIKIDDHLGYSRLSYYDKESEIYKEFKRIDIKNFLYENKGKNINSTIFINI